MRNALLSAAVAALSLAGCTKAGLPAPGAAAQATNGSSTVVASFEGKQITLGELDNYLAKDLYQLRSQGLESMILRQLVEREAKKAGKSEEDFLRGIAESSTPAVPDEELQKLYDQHKEAFDGKSFEEVKPFLQARQSQEKQQEAVMAYLESLKTKAQVKITLQEPRTNVAAEGPSKGPANAAVTIVEFSDFECPFCSRATKTVEQVMAAYAGKVKLVFRDFPLPFHQQAAKAAEAGLCANEQGKFWEMHDQMFGNQQALSPDELKASAKKLGLDSAKFDSCLDSGKYAAQVKKDADAGKEAGVSGTPAFFINGRMISGAQPFEKFKEIIDQELAGK